MKKTNKSFTELDMKKLKNMKSRTDISFRKSRRIFYKKYNVKLGIFPVCLVEDKISPIEYNFFRKYFTEQLFQLEKNSPKFNLCENLSKYMEFSDKEFSSLFEKIHFENFTNFVRDPYNKKLDMLKIRDYKKIRRNISVFFEGIFHARRYIELQRRGKYFYGNFFFLQFHQQTNIHS